MEVKVFNQFNPPIGDFNPVGDGTEPVFDYVEDKETGEVIYKEVRRTNLYGLIQASKDSADINYIVERMAKGDTSLLNARKGYFMDVSEMPRDVFEMQEMNKTIKDVYEKDAILKGLYASFEDYEKAFLEGKVFEAYIEANKKLSEVKKEEVKEDEVKSE